MCVCACKCVCVGVSESVVDGINITGLSPSGLSSAGRVLNRGYEFPRRCLRVQVRMVVADVNGFCDF